MTADLLPRGWAVATDIASRELQLLEGDVIVGDAIAAADLDELVNDVRGDVAVAVCARCGGFILDGEDSREVQVSAPYVSGIDYEGFTEWEFDTDTICGGCA